jgi:hypothetical protein
MHLQGRPQSIRHAWYATGSNNERQQTKHSNQRKPARDQRAHRPMHGKTPRAAPLADELLNCVQLRRRKRGGNAEMHRQISDEARRGSRDQRLSAASEPIDADFAGSAPCQA